MTTPLDSPDGHLPEKIGPYRLLDKLGEGASSVVHRAIQKYMEDPLAEEILNLNVKAGDVLIADADTENGKLKFSFKAKSEEPTKA